MSMDGAGVNETAFINIFTNQEKKKMQIFVLVYSKFGVIIFGGEWYTRLFSNVRGID
jgi:hypothetical protein